MSKPIKLINGAGIEVINLKYRVNHIFCINPPFMIDTSVWRKWSTLFPLVCTNVLLIYHIALTFLIQVSVYALLRSLLLLFFQGFPVGTKLGEQERISVPQAEYTKGEFSVSNCSTLVIWNSLFSVLQQTKHILKPHSSHAVSMCIPS